MANNLTTYGQNLVNDLLAETTCVYIGLLDVGGTELTGNNYSRVDGSTAWSASAAGTKTNDTLIEFAEPSGAWSEAVSVAFYVAASGGDAMLQKALTTPQTADVGSPVRFPIGNLSLTP